MKKLCFSIMLFLLLQASIFAESNSSLFNTIEQAIIFSLKNKFPQWQNAEIQAEPYYNKYKTKRISMLDTTGPFEVKAVLPEHAVMSRKITATVVISAQGVEQYSFTVRTQVAVFDTVCVSGCDIKKGELLTTQNIALKKVDIAAYGNEICKDIYRIAGWEAKTWIKKGDALVFWMVQPVPNFRKGEEVNLVYKKEGVILKFPGVASEDGFTGKKVKVYRSEGRSRFEGTVVKDKTVLIE